VQEQIGGFGDHFPEGVTSAPERMLLIHPLALLFVLLQESQSVNANDNNTKKAINYLPSKSHAPEAFPLDFANVLKEVTVYHAVQKPVPIFLGHVRYEPSEALAVETDLLRKTGLNKIVG
jgi:hypothetical protein